MREAGDFRAVLGVGRLVQEVDAMRRFVDKHAENRGRGFGIVARKGSQAGKVELGHGFEVCRQEAIQEFNQLGGREGFVQEPGEAALDVVRMFVGHAGRKRDDRKGVGTGNA